MRITRFEGDEQRPADWPWWTLVEAIIWIVGEEDPNQPDDPFGGDLDYSAREWAAKELRMALAQGRVTAHGLRSYSEQPHRIESVEWNTREVPITDLHGLKSWQNEPYSGIVVAKEEIRRLWPVSLASDEPRIAVRRGRGRRKGVGSLSTRDAPLIQEMRSMIERGGAASPYAAATSLLERAAGSGTDASKRKRLVDRYRQQFPDD